jgi:hypothetical protein
MWGHLSDETLMDIVSGTADGPARAHAASCDSCRSRVAEASQGLAFAGDAAVPEPSPLYWEAFRRQVSRRIEGDRRGAWVSWLLPVAAVAGLLAVAVPWLRPAGPAPSAAVLPAWSALPAGDQDGEMDVLRAVASADPDVALAFDRSTGAQDELSDLSDEESQDLADRLKARADQGGTL